MGRHYCYYSSKAVAAKLLKQFICCDITKFERSKILNSKIVWNGRVKLKCVTDFRLFTLVPSYPENINIGNFAGLNIQHFEVLRKHRLNDYSCLEHWERPKMLGKHFLFVLAILHVGVTFEIGCRIDCYHTWLRCHRMKWFKCLKQFQAHQLVELWPVGSYKQNGTICNRKWVPVAYCSLK